MAALSGIDPFTGQTKTITFAQGAPISAVSAGGEADCYLAPGLIDLQVNGYAGFDLNSSDLKPETVSALARTLLAHGVTCFLPTVITASETAILAALSAIASACENDPLVENMVAGIHVEGPFISRRMARAGASRGSGPRARHRRGQALAGGLRGRVRMITLSPHWPNSDAFIADACAMDIAVAIGHTDATPEQIHAAVAAGARLSTHLGNGAATMLPGTNFIWAQLADERLTATFIADGHHLPADTLKAMLRAKGLEDRCSFPMWRRWAGLRPGSTGNPSAGRVELAANGRLSIAGTPYLAGAAQSQRGYCKHHRADGSGAWRCAATGN